jgi:hypothetical protein
LTGLASYRFEKRIYIPLPDPIRTRVTLGLIREGAVIRLGELTRRRADVEVEHFDARGRVGLRDALMQPVRKVLSATHFKEVRSGPALRDTCILHRWVGALDRDLDLRIFAVWVVSLSRPWQTTMQ